MEREALRALILEKDAMEKEIMDLNEALSTDNLGGVSTPVVDAEGFPRADIDVHTTLTLRNRLARLNTDHKALMARIEQGLLGALPPSRPSGGPPPPPPVSRPPIVAASADAAPTGATPLVTAASTGPIPMEVVDVSELALEGDGLTPFALVDEVAADGPAGAAGLHVGDELLRFGALHCRNHDGLRGLARLTQRSVGEPIGLLVLRTAAAPAPAEPAEAAGAARRGKHVVRLELVPRRWAGNGLLGCHLQPL